MEKVGSELQSKQETRASRTGLKPDVGVFRLVARGIGSIIGSGLFAMPAVIGSVAGPTLIPSVVPAGAKTTVLAIAYSELGPAFPLTGGLRSFAIGFRRC
jgi:APA family basic amino acid/polyamine antiporter